MPGNCIRRELLWDDDGIITSSLTVLYSALKCVILKCLDNKTTEDNLFCYLTTCRMFRAFNKPVLNVEIMNKWWNNNNVFLYIAHNLKGFLHFVGCNSYQRSSGLETGTYAVLQVLCSFLESNIIILISSDLTVQTLRYVFIYSVSRKLKIKIMQTPYMS